VLALPCLTTPRKVGSSLNTRFKEAFERSLRCVFTHLRGVLCFRSRVHIQRLDSLKNEEEERREGARREGGGGGDRQSILLVRLVCILQESTTIWQPPRLTHGGCNASVGVSETDGVKITIKEYFGCEGNVPSDLQPVSCTYVAVVGMCVVYGIRI
jgi:hypothetical protein